MYSHASVARLFWTFDKHHIWFRMHRLGKRHGKSGLETQMECVFCKYQIENLFETIVSSVSSLSLLKGFMVARSMFVEEVIHTCSHLYVF